MIRKLTLVMLLATLVVYAEDKPKKGEIDKDLKIEILRAQRQFLSDVNVLNEARATVNKGDELLRQLFARADKACGDNHKANPVTLECDEVKNEKVTPTPVPAAKPSK